MLAPNIFQLDELSFLKKSKHRWQGSYSSKDEHQLYHENQKLYLLQNLRNITYQHNQIIAKIFFFEKHIKKDTSAEESHQLNKNQNNSMKYMKQEKFYEEIIVITQKQILPLKNFYDLLNKKIPDRKQFSSLVSKIQTFQTRTRHFFKQKIFKEYDIDYKNKQFLNFSIYLQKSKPNSLDFTFDHKIDKEQFFNQFIKRNNKFFIKCSITNFNIEPDMDIKEIDNIVQTPQPFEITTQPILRTLVSQYYQLYNKFSYSPEMSLQQLKKYVKPFDKVQFQLDEDHLKLQVYKNYPLLRSKFYLPVKFNDPLTQQRLQGPIFSNSNPQCMYSHFVGYNADSIKILQGSHCQYCGSEIQSLQQNSILTQLRDSIFNPYKTDVFFNSQFNRFKLIIKTKITTQSQQQSPRQNQSFRTQIKYLNFMHLRTNLKKIYIKNRNKFNQFLKQEKFSLAFNLWGKRYLIIDPVRGRNCAHYQFTDLRLLYLNKITQNTFSCPICQDIFTDNEILYLKQVQILMKYIKHKTETIPELTSDAECWINHNSETLCLIYKTKDKQGNIQDKMEEVKGFYRTLIDPYIGFNEYALGIPDKYQQKMKEKFMFGFGDNHGQNFYEDEQY